MLAEVIRIVADRWGVGLLGFHEPDVFPDLLWGNRFIQAIAHKQRFAQVIKAEIAARTRHGILALAVAIDNTLDAFGGDAVSIVSHFNKDDSSASTIMLIHVKNRLRCCTRPSERIKYNRVFSCSNLNYTLYQSNRFWIVKSCWRTEDFSNLFCSFLRMPDALVIPPSPNVFTLPFR